jgi:hypothetical protein
LFGGFEVDEFEGAEEQVVHGSTHIESAVPSGYADGAVVTDQFFDGSRNIRADQIVEVGAGHRSGKPTDRLYDWCEVSITGSFSRSLDGTTAGMAENDERFDAEFRNGIVEACESCCARCVSCDTYDKQTSRRLIENHRWGYPCIGTSQDRRLGHMFRGNLDGPTFDSTVRLDQLTPRTLIRH